MSSDRFATSADGTSASHPPTSSRGPAARIRVRGGEGPRGQVGLGVGLHQALHAGEVALQGTANPQAENLEFQSSDSVRFLILSVSGDFASRR